MTEPATERGFAIVTGAARGMGAAIAVQLAADDFDLVLVDAPHTASPADGGIAEPAYPLGTMEQLEGVAAACREFGGAAHAVAGDVRSDRDLMNAVALIPAGRLRAAVAVAGIIGSDKPAWEFSRDELTVDLDTNFHGVANLARAAVPLLLTAPTGSGRFVAVVSTAGETGLPRLAGYVSSKHAALGYLRSLSADLGRFGVTANAVLPGSTRTALLERSARAYDLPDVEQFATHQRLGRLIEPEEIAAAVSWLCSPGATAVTGAAIRVDGGFVG